MSRRSTYCCAPSIIWVRDADQTLLVDQETKQSWSLRGVSAVIWDLLTVGYSHQRIVPLLSLRKNESEEQKKACTSLLLLVIIVRMQ